MTETLTPLMCVDDIDSWLVGVYKQELELVLVVSFMYTVYIILVFPVLEAECQVENKFDDGF